MFWQALKDELNTLTMKAEREIKVRRVAFYSPVTYSIECRHHKETESKFCLCVYVSEIVCVSVCVSEFVCLPVCVCVRVSLSVCVSQLEL